MNPLLILTVAAVALAALMSLITWNVLREDRRRSDARVAMLAADITRLDAASDPDLLLQGETTVPAAPAGLSQPLPRRAVLSVVGAAAFVVAAVGAVVALGMSGTHPVAPHRGTETTPHVTPATTLAPAAAVDPPAQTLELVALSHEREPGGLVVRGIVRNPTGAPGADHLSAVVLLFDGEGGFISSGRAEVSTTGLSGMTEAPFMITVPEAVGVARYRVSFRSHDRIVPHVDRRR